MGSCTVKYHTPVAVPPLFPISNFTAAISSGFIGERCRKSPVAGSITPTARMRTERSAGPLETGFGTVTVPDSPVDGRFLTGVVTTVPATTRIVPVPCGREVEVVALGIKMTEIGTSIVEVPESTGVKVTFEILPIVNALPQGIAALAPDAVVASKRKPDLHW